MYDEVWRTNDIQYTDSRALAQWNLVVVQLLKAEIYQNWCHHVRFKTPLSGKPASAG